MISSPNSRVAVRMSRRWRARAALSLRMILGLTLCLYAGIEVSSLIAEEPASAVVLPAERRPYDVRLLVAVEPLALDAAAVESVIRDVDQTARRCAGDLWSLKVSEISWLGPANGRGLQRVTRLFRAEHYPDESADVWFLATIEVRPVGTRVSVRSWQPDVQLETAIEFLDVVDPREIPVVLVRLCRNLMRPMGVVEQVSERTVRVRLRAGEIIPPDPSFHQLAKGDLLMPMLAYRDKNNTVEKLQMIPWTYVSVDDVDASTVTGTVQSGLKLALGGKRRGRIDTLVVALRPQHPSTRVELLTQTKPIVPLVAHRIEVRTESVIPRPNDDHPDVNPDSTLLQELLTDRRGLTKVSVNPAHSLVWLFTYSGQHMLARVPFVPGIVAQAKLEVPDDATRLTAEADLQMLQGEVIDAVALRNTAIATIRAAAKKDDWPTVKLKLDLLKRNSNVRELEDRLNVVRVMGTTAAKARRDRAAEVRINRMCDETANLLKVHLSPDKVTALSEEMDALQSAEDKGDEKKKKLRVMNSRAQVIR